MSDESIFATALAIPNPVARAEFLDRACAGNLELRQEVEALLAAHAASNALDQPPLFGKATTEDHTATEVAGVVIAGRYKLIEEIGEGGMGTVWVALQTEPVRRTVAIKLIKAGMDSKAVLARFDAERQALAMMDHPNIARVLDGGATSEGRPFFVMELVKGMPITQYCDDRKLTPRQRLELFIPICQAIQHAHQKGVIHRDIKPSNVLIAMYDDKAVPKVIDFGIAKATGSTLTDHTLMTGFGAVVGTPEYMSPEQANLNNLDIDTRSDVFSLGVLLYELLTGSTPVDRKSLGKAAILEVLRIVREVEAPRPSVRLSSSGTLPSVAANRSTDPVKLSRLLKRDLDWVVLKAMEKDRSRRYESANGFAADVQRYLEGEAVQAHPPSKLYRLRKFARKNRVILATASAFVGLLLASVAVSSWLAVQAKRAEAMAEKKRIDAEWNAKLAEFNMRLYSESMEGQTKSLIEIDILAKGLAIDLNVEELNKNQKVGLLQLANTIKLMPDVTFFKFGSVLDDVKIQEIQELATTYHEATGRNVTIPTGLTSVARDIDPKLRQLREFITAAILAAGQNHAPLLPPITHDGQMVIQFHLSLNGRTLLTLGADATARLWDVRTITQIAMLRKGDELVVDCGLSPDGKTLFTADEAGVIRFWEQGSGKYRADTAPRPDHYTLVRESVYETYDNGSAAFSVITHPRSKCILIGNGRVITRRVAAKLRSGSEHTLVDQYLTGPVELWDTDTGRWVARLDEPGTDADQFRFLPQAKTIVSIKNKSEVVIYAVDNGQVIARLDHGPEWVNKISTNPSGSSLATLSSHPLSSKSTVQIWDNRDWRISPMRIASEKVNSDNFLSFISDDVLMIGKSTNIFEESEMRLYRRGQPKPIATMAGVDPICHCIGETILRDDGSLCDINTLQRLRPPATKKLHPDLMKFALDGRFVVSVAEDRQVLIDTKTEKHFPSGRFERDGARNIPGFGVVTAWQGPRAEILIIPSADHLNIPADLLELWAKVVVCGELSPEGEFKKWDEATWERKRKELAAIPPPYSDFPFPGYVAADKLHWLRAEYGEEKNDAEKHRLAIELLRRSELSGDRNEVVRWRAEKSRFEPQIAPPPREKR